MKTICQVLEVSESGYYAWCKREPSQRQVENECLTSPAMLTIKAFWTEVARMGSYLDRSGDGPPGWKALWKGWLQVQTLLEGVRLASRLPL